MQTILTARDILVCRRAGAQPGRLQLKGGGSSSAAPGPQPAATAGTSTRLLLRHSLPAHQLLAQVDAMASGSCCSLSGDGGSSMSLSASTGIRSHPISIGGEDLDPPAGRRRLAGAGLPLEFYAAPSRITTTAVITTAGQRRRRRSSSSSSSSKKVERSTGASPCAGSSSSSSIDNDQPASPAGTSRSSREWVRQQSSWLAGRTAELLAAWW